MLIGEGGRVQLRIGIAMMCGAILGAVVGSVIPRPVGLGVLPRSIRERVQTPAALVRYQWPSPPDEKDPSGRSDPSPARVKARTALPAESLVDV